MHTPKVKRLPDPKLPLPVRILHTPTPTGVGTVGAALIAAAQKAVK